jgi:dihydrofolate synthase/folylpolyglutamate synthase
MRLGLDPMRAACARRDHPEGAFAAVHVAGTNGKGSVCAMVESIARAHGFRTGLYTSPHLCRFAERIRIQGEPLDDAALTPLLADALEERDLSFFETATLTAFLAFRAARVEVAMVEVGIGGRLDATNVLPRPRAAAITRIALDHSERLGPTLVDIAREKAGIAKPGLEIILGHMPESLRAAIDEVASRSGATTASVDLIEPPAEIGLAGAHQKDNARVAVAIGRKLGASSAAIAHGIASARWPGRLERIGRHLLDAAHNLDGAEALARSVRALGVAPAQTALIFGALEHKDYASMLTCLGPLAARRVYVAPRALARNAIPPASLAAVVPGVVARDVAHALSLAEGELVVIAGSIMLVGQARALLLGLPCDPAVAL